MSAEEKKQEMQTMVEVLENLSHENLLMAKGFALGLQAQEEQKAS